MQIVSTIQKLHSQRERLNCFHKEKAIAILHFIRSVSKRMLRRRRRTHYPSNSQSYSMLPWVAKNCYTYLDMFRIVKQSKQSEDTTFVKVTGMLASSCMWSASSVNCCCCFCRVSRSRVISCLANTTLQSSYSTTKTLKIVIVKP